MDIPEDLTWPAGDWGVDYDDVSIVGEDHHLAGCAEFVGAISRAFEKGHPFGVRLQREPDNPHDPLAIRVFGHWTTKGWFSSESHEVAIGYIGRKLAYLIHQDHGPDAPLAATLVGIDTNPINIRINILT